MKKKGFTLIELLAVIIILAIVALVATPIILNVVADARRSAGLSEARLIYSGINNYCEEAKLRKQLNGTENICEDGVTIDEVSSMVNLGNAKIIKLTYINKVTELVVESNGQVIELQPDGTFIIDGEVAGGDPVTPPVESKDLASTLLEQYDESNTTGLLKDSTGYYYKGTNEEVANNFVWFAGHLWRVISIDNDNNLTMITQQPLTAIQPASAVWTQEAEYETSYINRWLNNEETGVFYKSLNEEDKSKILENSFNIGMYDSVSEATTIRKVGLLDVAQYNKAGRQDSFLDIKDMFWLGNCYDTSSDFIVAGGGVLNPSNLSSAGGVRPVIKTSGLSFTAGKGTLDDPYREKSETTNTANIKVGEYISIPTTGGDCGEDKKCLFRVVSKDDDSIKVILNGVLSDTSQFGSTSTYEFGNTVDLLLKEFAETINVNYRHKLGKIFSIGTYGDGADYIAVRNGIYLSTVGLPVVGEMFSGNDTDISAGSATRTFVNIDTIENPNVSNYFWKMNAYDTSNVLYIDYTGSLNKVTPSIYAGVRAVLILNASSSLIFTAGDGTAENPFVLE